MSTSVRLSYDKLYIGGKWVSSSDDTVIDVVSPVTEKVIGSTPAGTKADVDAAVAAARKAFDEGEWPRMSVKERAEALRRVRDIYEKRSEEMADLITAEMGCPIMVSKAFQAHFPIYTIDYYSQLAEEFAFEERRGNALVVREPVGVAAAIVPWNMPQAVLMIKMAPALLAGCPVIAKPAEETPIDGLLLAEMFEEAGFPPGVVSIIPAGREVGEHLVAHPGVDKVAFTGSTAAGKRVGELCGQDMRRVSLELGGKSAAIILEDADLTTTLQGLRMAAFLNSGQVCINQTRIVAPRSRYDEIVDGLCELASTMAVGDPAEPTTEVGPLVASRQRDRVEGYIRKGVEEGATVAYGGGRPASQPTGWYVEPTIFRDVDNRMTIAQEEIFGPVLAVIPYETDDEAVAIANDSTYGLAGGVWTSDVDHGIEIARRVRTGQIGINGADPGLGSPFGGFKQSGVGREAGPEGLMNYLEIKSIPFPAAG